MAPPGSKLAPAEVSYLSFEGGGGKGGAYLGALAALAEPGLEFFQTRIVGDGVDHFLDVRKIRGIAGASAGAITAALIASGYGLRELYDFMTDESLLASFYDDPHDAKGNRERLVYSKAKTEIESSPARRRFWIEEWAVSSSPLWRKFLFELQAAQLKEEARLAGLLVAPLVAKAIAGWIGPMFPSAVKTITRNPDVLAEYLDNLTFDLGLFSGVEIWKVLDGMIGSKPTPSTGAGPLPDRRGITFAQHKKLHGVDLRLTGTNLETGQSRIFSAARTHTPEFRVIDAVRISLSLPFFFKPFVISVGPYRGTWIDGGILNNNPIHAFDDPDAPGTINPNLLGIRLGADCPSPQKPMPIHDTGDLAQALSTVMLGLSELGQIRTPQERAQTIALEVDPLSTFEFVADKEVLHAVCCRAARQTLGYFGFEARGAGNLIPQLFGRPCP